jgi:hypothetical protein
VVRIRSLLIVNVTDSLRFFKPRLLQHLGTFQDGGLQYNNPLNIAIWETRYAWPGRTVDFALSIGTGTTDHDAFSAGAHSPVKDRFMSRLFRTFMKSLDGERVWREIFNSLTEREKGRYHRLNLPMKGKEPTLDDTMAITTLKSQSQDWIKADRRVLLTLDSIYASMFYFEFDEMPTHAGDNYTCIGHIYCRLNTTPQGRKYLYEKLESTASYFLVLGEPTRCIDQIPNCSSLPPFKRKVKFTLETLEDDVGITLLGLTSSPTTISGLPQSATEIIRMQQLHSVFGMADCSRREKSLPPLPV